MVLGGEWFCTSSVGYSEDWEYTVVPLSPALKVVGLCLGFSPNKPRISLRDLTSFTSASDPRPGNGWYPNVMGPSRVPRPGPASHSSHISPHSPLTCLLIHHILVTLAFPFFRDIELLPHLTYLPKCCSLCLEHILSYFS